MEAIVSSVEKSTPDVFNPFPGLRPFEADEDHLFFGRERETDELLRRLRQHRFLSVLGTSGSGKSSLVRSGLIPSLYSGFMMKAGSDWRVAVLRPGEDPIGNLAAALDHEDVLGGGELAGANRVMMEATLRRSTLGLADCVRHAGMAPHENLLVVVDQFEELFRFRETRRLHGSRDEAIVFAKLLLAAAHQEEVPVYVVLTMRSDFIGDCMEYPGLPEAVNDGQYLIPRMTRDELRQAIEGPAAVGGGEIAPRLVARLLNEVGDDPDQLPVLQHALMRTWDLWEAGGGPGEEGGGDGAVDLAHYDAVGTMTEALSRHAEEAFAELPEGKPRRVAEQLFKALTDKRKDDRGVRRPTAVREVAAIADVTDADVIQAVEVFRKPGRSFLMPPVGATLGPDSILDLSHESLMRGWTRLVDWVDDETQSGKAFRRLCRAARRYRDGQATLWVEPELSFGLKWRAESGANEAWAARYDPDFADALAFLDESKAAHDAEIEAIERERRAKLRRSRILSAVLGTAALVTLAFGLFAVRAGRIAQQAEQVAILEAQKAAAVSDFLVELFEVADPEEARGATITAQEILDEGARKIDTVLADQPEVQARLMGTIGKVYGSLGLYDEARPLAERARQTSIEVLGARHPDTLEATAGLAEIYLQQGQFTDAEELYSEVLGGRLAALGPDAPETLQARADLAEALQSQGRLADAETEARTALDGLTATLGRDAEETLAATFRLGDVLEELGRYPEAEELLVRAWEGQQRVLGAESSDTVATMGALGGLFVELGRYDEAERLYTDSLESRRAMFGDEHPKTLVARAHLGDLDQERGRWADAERRKSTVLETRRRVLGDDHPSTINAIASLSWQYRISSRLDDAERLAEEGYRTAIRVFGEKDPKAREPANVRASVYISQGRYDKAEEILAENLEIYRDLYGDSHPATRTARNNLAVVYADWGRGDRALELYRENFELSKETLGPDNPSTLFFQKNMTWALGRQRRWEEALPLVIDLLERYRRVLGNDNPDTIDAVNARAATHRAMKELDEARVLFTERYESNRRVFGEVHPRTMYALWGLSRFKQQLGEFEEALPLQERILETALKLFGEEHPDVVNAYGSLATVYGRLERPADALEMREKAMQIRRRLASREGAGSHYKNSYASALTNAQSELQNPPEAVKFALQANEQSGHGNRNYLATLAEAYFKDGQVDKAIETQRRALELVAEDDRGARTRLESRLGEFYEASGDPAMVRQAQIAELAREKVAADAPGASPVARNDYVWELLRAHPADLQDPDEALRRSLAVNEDTGHSDHSLLDALALAYYRTGRRQEAVETTDRILTIVPEDDVWTRYRIERRRMVYQANETRKIDAAALPGEWNGTAGPIRWGVKIEPEGEHLVGRITTENPNRPVGSILFRFDPTNSSLEILEADSGFTNQRYEPGDYRVLDNGDFIFWNPKSWFPLHYTRP